MLSQVASRFPMIWLTCVGLLIFLTVFLGVVAWVFRKGSGEVYAKAAHFPFAGSEDEGNPSTPNPQGAK